MNRKNNRNLLGVIALIAICAFMLISCPQQTSTLAKENPRALTLNYNGRSTIYYYLNNNWYSDKECKNVVEDLTLQPPAAQTATITVNFNEGTAQATGEGEYFQEGSNSFTWNFVKYVKAGDESKADYFNGELKLPENGISENVTLTAEYEQTEVVRKLPVLVREGITFGGYQRVNETVEADTPITVTPGLIATYNAIWTTYKTLTLNIGEQEQKLYYGSNGAWYKALSDDGLLLDENKVTGDEVKFNIPSAPTWTVTFKKNPISGMNDSEITITPASVDVTPDLTLTPGDLIDNTGKVVASSIDGDKVVTGTYPPKAIGQSVTPSSTNLNYEFEKWTANGEDITDIADHQVNGNTEIVANWKNLSDFKVLTIKDGGVVKEKAYYNTADGKWYVSNITTSGEKTSVATLPNREYIITLNYDNGSPNGSGSVPTSFRGYGVDGTTSAVIGTNGSLSGYTIDKDTELVSLWSEAKFIKPVQPTKDGYTFDDWYKDGQQYDFNSVVTEAITLTARWIQKTYNTLTLNIGENNYSKVLYYGSDSAWYKALGNDDLLLNENKVTGDNVKFNIPERIWTVTFNKNTPAGAIDSEITITSESVEVKPELILSDDSYIDKATGKVSVDSIDGDKVVTGTYPPKAIGQSVTAESTNRNYEFEKWTANGEDVANIANYEVNGNTEIVANWNNISSFKVLTVKDGDVVKEKAYYNTADGKWYVSNITTSGEKTSVATLPNREYIITLNYDNGSPNGSGSVPTSFRGYGVDGTTSAVIGTNGSLYTIQTDGSISFYTIDKDTVLVSLWSEVKFTEPSEQPTKDGYMFDSWYKDGQQYDFNSVVTGAMTLTAHWTKKTFKTLTFDITGLESSAAAQTLYYGNDGAWYKALGNDDLLLTKNKVTGDEVKFNIPETPTWTVSLNKNTPSSLSDDAITFSPNQLTLYPKDGVLSTDQYISKDGIVKVTSITENVNVTLDTSRRRTSENVTATTPDSINLVGWLNGAEEISKLSEYYVTADNINLNASWGYKVSIGELDVPNADIYDADRGFYTTTQDIDESVKDKSKQLRVAYYTEGETVKLYYCNDSIMGIEITLKNEWSGETKLINKVGHHDYRYSLLEIAPMVNQPLSISFKVTKSEQV